MNILYLLTRPMMGNQTVCICSVFSVAELFHVAHKLVDLYPTNAVCHPLYCFYYSTVILFLLYVPLSFVHSCTLVHVAGGEMLCGITNTDEKCLLSPVRWHINAQ